jgi:transglutaminase-like putative cysteine protease
VLTSTPALDRQSRALSPAPITASRDDAGSETGDLRFGLDLAATLGLIAYSITVGIGFSRVFFDWDFLRDLVVIVVAGHGASYVMRRLRLPSLVAIPVLLLGLTWLVAWMYYPDTFSAVFPLSETWNAVRDDYRMVQDEFQSTTPPVIYSGGWAFLAGATTAATVWLSDTFAFRAQARGEALVPGAVLFVFIAALGVDENRAECSLAVVGAGFLALALLRLRLERRPRTVLGRARHPLMGVAPGVLGAAALVVAGAWAVAPHLPGADAEPLFDTHNGRGGVTEIVSPLVDIRSRIVNQAETQMFTMTATAPSYWRISALPRFDGNRWDVAENEVEGDGDTLPAQSAAAVENDQVLVIDALDGPLLPVAPEPVSAGSDGIGMAYFADSASLIKTNDDLDEGDTFRMRSAMPRFTVDALAAATSDDPPDGAFLALPDDLPPVIAETALEVTAGATTNFERMVTLQDWFRTTFTYSTEIPDGHSSSAIVNFLENRVGYCEQFSGTFAAMARTLGIPARVAVGFTQGEANEDGAYEVLGRNAHAWPEVWFDGYGWVPFEPTPGRGMPGAEAYTGIRPEQDTGETPVTTTTTTTTTLPPTTTTLAGQTPPPPGQTTTTLPPTTTTLPRDLSHSFSSGFPWFLALVGAAVLALLIALPELVRRWRRRRHGPITDPVHALLELWDRALRALGAMGFRGDPTQTPIEVSDRAATVFPGVAAPLHELAVVATAASFAPRDDVAQIAASGWSATDHNGPHDWCQTIESVAEESLGWRARLRRYFTVWH